MESDGVFAPSIEDHNMHNQRPRRLRRDGIRQLVSETSLTTHDLVAPLFVDASADERIPIPSMPGHDRVPLDSIVERAREVESTGISSVMLFGIPASKDEEGSRAWADNGIIQKALRILSNETNLYLITDVCLCEYTDHGHCGVLEPDARTSSRSLTVANDATLKRLARTAVSHVDAGADMVAPSSMTDGMVGAIRAGLDSAGYQTVPILSYAVKYESSFYGPFRDAADGAPAFGDRRHYQMDPANGREAVREARLDVEEGADIVMVKPATAYLDVIKTVSETVDVPVAAYNVSGEYAMIVAAEKQGWLDQQATAIESLLAMKRAGASIIVTYFAEEVGQQLPA